ncbi:hypothetical protein IE53DRAFT_200431 [Violaceomyces palustris]|uniref:Uncharacterized protein n=1 Tax=Violaceomyces palustris TaxID=1673888 RepID=A0ACD0NRD9_9BASI|nr:hypothetical protein IE53DRAFT_200431 [Violaceomyces palustris]
MFRAGKKKSQIAKELGLSYQTIQSLILKVQRTGSSENQFNPNGNPKYSQRDIRKLVRMAQ